MTDSMNFGPAWLRQLSSEGSTGGGAGTRYQLADHRYGREEMLALFDNSVKPPACLVNFKRLYSEKTLAPLALLPLSEEEEVNFQRGSWQVRPTTLNGPPRGRGGGLSDRGGRGSRGRGTYPSYGRPSNYESGWGNGEPSDWSPRKEYGTRPSMENWRKGRSSEEDDGWRSVAGKGIHEKWVRSASWRTDGESEERGGPPERGGRTSWHDSNRGPPKRSWDSEDHLPEWANENPSESGGSFDERGAFHGSDDEQLDPRRDSSRREGLQKSTSQQHITHKVHPPLSTSKSTMSLVKDEDVHKRKEENEVPKEPDEVPSREVSPQGIESKGFKSESIEKHLRDVNSNKEKVKSDGPPKLSDKHLMGNPLVQNRIEDSEFEKRQEDFVSKLVVDEEPQQPVPVPNNFDLSSLPPPPNLAAPSQDKWFYQDPQGQMQGPFTNMEMSEWFKAGYFGQDLKIRRHCDERFFLLGELMSMCGTSNPFQTTVRFPVLKNDVSKMPEGDALQFQYLSQMAAYKQAQARVLADPWNALTLQQQELAAQRLIMQQQQQQQQVQQDLQYMQQQPPANQLMHMINQMQQANKLPGSALLDKQPPNMPSSLDPHLHMHMNNFLSLQNRLPNNLPTHMPPPMPSAVPTSMPPDGRTANLSGLQTAPIPMPGMQGGLTAALGLNVPRAVPTNGTESMGSGQSGEPIDPISSLLKQLQQQKQHSQQQVESLWQSNQFNTPTPGPPQQQWQPPQVPDMPLSMWDMQQASQSPVSAPQQPEPQPAKQPEKPPKDKEKENRSKDEAKEQKKKKEQEEKQQKKEAEEKRKQEQRRIEAEKKSETERKKKEEERIRKELEKAKKEAEEKRLKELEEKRRLKEQRKAEEEARKKAEEFKKLEEERMQKEKEQRETEEKQRVEEKRHEQMSLAKAAPWCQTNSSMGMSLADIQKAEKERKLQEAVLQQQRAQLEREIQQQQQQQQQLEKSGGLQLSWAKNPVEPRKIKSLAEIQAEEQERLAKETAEARLKREKEARETPQLQNTSSIWSSQNLTWANSSTSINSQWPSSGGLSGFWDDSSQQQQQQRVAQPHTKPSGVTKSCSMSVIGSMTKQQVMLQQQKVQQQKAKTKKEEPTAPAATAKKNHNNNNNGSLYDEFTTWCHKALANFSSDVDIPTFVSFLRDIESAFDVREYCKDYLGDSNTTTQFANNFLEKRRSFKPKNAYKDDMCSPAPAITPSTQHSTEFQEVKGKNKKNKKSKMLKVDARILGFNVTSAPDRINVGDRDYGDNS